MSEEKLEAEERQKRDSIPAMIVRDDTIAALGTASGRGAISIIRLSGRKAHEIGERLLRPWPTTARQVVLATVWDPRDGSTIDQALITRFDAPWSYTGEPMCEIACHGGTAVSAAVLEVLALLGARSAEPGEFTRRAVLNGKLDLVRAEAVGDLVDARTQALRRVAVAQLDGSLTRALAELRDRVIHIEALLAYDIDFPDEDDGPIDRASITRVAQEAMQSISLLLTTTPLGEIAREGAVVVIAGLPNAGKSSLFNALLGEGRAIVTDQPGTTRDAIEARVESGKWPLRLVDTAGIRETTDVIERLGIEVSERWLRQAHVVLVCGTTVDELREAIARLDALGSAPRIAVFTKRDLVDSSLLAHPVEQLTGADTTVGVSASHREGLSELLRALHHVLEQHVGAVTPDLPIVTRARHQEALEHALGELREFVSLWERGAAPATVAAVHVRSAVSAMDELIGSVDVEDVLDRVFRSFCVGK